MCLKSGYAAVNNVCIVQDRGQLQVSMNTLMKLRPL
jgi:hypothetical protein